MKFKPHKEWESDCYNYTIAQYGRNEFCVVYNDGGVMLGLGDSKSLAAAKKVCMLHAKKNAVEAKKVRSGRK